MTSGVTELLPSIKFFFCHCPAMSASCAPLLDALKDCLLHSDCVVKKGLLPSQCLREHTDELPEKCRSLRQATFECKRGLVCRAAPPCFNIHAD
jgi:Cytochrome c oxidase assembly protein PET191